MPDIFPIRAPVFAEARGMAVVVVFGLTTSTLLTLFVIPAVYGWFERGKPAMVNEADGLDG